MSEEDWPPDNPPNIPTGTIQSIDDLPPDGPLVKRPIGFFYFPDDEEVEDQRPGGQWKRALMILVFVLLIAAFG